MRAPLLPVSILSLFLSCAGVCQAQSAAPAQTAAEQNKPSPPGASGAVEKRTERIHIEDAGARIDEVRVGGETKTIEVQPKGGMPAYQVEPTKGERSWKILGF
ncbi:MAG: hypothetical protein Q7T10_20235 [Rhodoferax sp.]|uniref:hypothetical protein n=1 Tax=Rhodoferax sp. TaxID=50421 RepID=UPI0027174F41|nr:hypothetical protein [Rhodoferax sp.]MDO8451129.1 hypothetical protein [Rhodoferax sp.]